RPVGRRGGASSQANAAAGANRPRRALRALTARGPQKPTTEAAATPSHGAAKRVAAPAATPTPHAISRRPRNRRSSRQPERGAGTTTPCETCGLSLTEDLSVSGTSLLGDFGLLRHPAQARRRAVKADELEAVVWGHIKQLLNDPATLLEQFEAFA